MHAELSAGAVATFERRDPQVMRVAAI